MYAQPFFNFSNIVTLLLLVIAVIVFVRVMLSQSRVTQRNKEVIRKNDEHRKYIVEQNTMAQAKRDEQIRLLNELVENQKEILELLKRQ